jgi:hypothetical protein
MRCTVGMQISAGNHCMYRQYAEYCFGDCIVKNLLFVENMLVMGNYYKCIIPEESTCR